MVAQVVAQPAAGVKDPDALRLLAGQNKRRGPSAKGGCSDEYQRRPSWWMDPGAAANETGATASKGSLEVRAYKGRPFYEARWRDINRAQHRKRLGPAWVELDAEGNWVPKRGRVRKGHLDKRRAYPLMAEVIEEHEERLLREVPERSDALFEEAAAAWLEHLRTEKRVKPSTLLNYGILLAQPEERQGSTEGTDHAGLRRTPAVRHRCHRRPGLPRAS